MKPFSANIQRPLGVCIHILVWTLIFFFPIILSGDTSFTDINWSDYFRHIKMPALLLLVFYLNYLWLVPRYLLSRKNRSFILWNLLLIACCLSLTQWNKPQPTQEEKRQEEMAQQREVPREERGNEELRTSPAPQEGAHFEQGAHTPPPFHPQNHYGFHRPSRWNFMLRDVIILLCTIGLSAAIKMSSEWRKAKVALQEAELKNLRNQMNPHFLLNTLNNIYALIAFDAEKAQQAVHDLSKLLRHLLYENQQTYVPLSHEVDFIHNYIELMRIRLSKEVEVDIQIDVPDNSAVEIAPLIFISLIENAFKHGISSTEKSFIHIRIIQKGNEEVICKISNSNHPKKDTDKSGSGIGLEQVKKRLELLYPGRYQWMKSISEDGKVYTSKLVIKV